MTDTVIIGASYRSNRDASEIQTELWQLIKDSHVDRTFL